MNKTISMQEIRKDVPGFLERIAAGDTITVIYHSRPLVTVQKQAEIAEDPREQVKRILAASEKARASAKGTLDPNKTIKQLYAETAGEKYGIRRR